MRIGGALACIFLWSSTASCGASAWDWARLAVTIAISSPGQAAKATAATSTSLAFLNGILSFMKEIISPNYLKKRPKRRIAMTIL